MLKEQDVLLRTLAKDSNSLTHNEPLQPELITIHPGSVSLAGSASAPAIKKSKAPLLSLILVFCLVAGLFAYLLLSKS